MKKEQVALSDIDLSERIGEFVKSSTTFSKDTLFTELVKNFKEQTWWDDIFYPTFLEEVSTFQTTFSKLSDKLKLDDFEYIKDVIVNVNSSYEASTVRHTLYMFLSSKIKLVLGKILNKQKLSEKMLSEESIKENPIYGVIASITNNKNYDDVIKNVKTVLSLLEKLDKLYIEVANDDMIVKNISILALVTFTIFKQILLRTLGMNDKNTMMDLLQTVSPVQKDNIKLSCDIVSILVSSLKKQLENTIIDNDALKMSVEALREKRKQELIDAYKVDDEERELQKQLKKLGLDNWADILTGEDDIVSEDVKQSNNVQSVVKDEYEEEKDYVYATYQGENADDDEVEEDYVSYESYDY